jgi:hypothetical protein
VLSFAIFGAPAVIISFGVGIPFNRRRNPLPPVQKPTPLRPITSLTQRLSWQQIVPILILILIFLIFEAW